MPRQEGPEKGLLVRRRRHSLSAVCRLPAMVVAINRPTIGEVEMEQAVGQLRASARAAKQKLVSGGSSSPSCLLGGLWPCIDPVPA